MSENGTVAATEQTTENEAVAATEQTTDSTTAEVTETPADTEDISYHAVEKEGNVTAIWEMQGRKHVRTIAPRSEEGKQILALFETAG
ncbi:MAG: hypothetical protein M3T96_02260 [Acidobacteriota bacterium]|nr:hypothetical protein [Acidobacteriota bacterium]